MATSCGALLLGDYSTAPGDRGGFLDRQPTTSRLRVLEKEYTLIVFAHPHCPCTRATLRELDFLMSRTGDRVGAIVAFVKPRGMEEEWCRTDLWRRANLIRMTRVACDPGGEEAKLYGAQTSGHVMLFESRGACVFSGGLTPSRGHDGANPGRAAILSIVFSGSSDRSSTEVYGCRLTGSNETICSSACMDSR